MKSTRAGAAILLDPDLRRRAWDVLRPVWSRPDLAGVFPDLIAEHADELIEATRRKAAGPARPWFDDWSALKAILPPARRVDALKSLLQAAGPGSVRPEDRPALVRASGLTPPAPPQPCRNPCAGFSAPATPPRFGPS